MQIIGFVGPKSAGKDASAKILIDAKIADGRIAFADPLKKMCSEIFEIPPRLFIDPILKEKPLASPVILTIKKLRAVRDMCVKIIPEHASGVTLYNSSLSSVCGLENREINTPRELLQVVGSDFIREKIYPLWHIKAAFLSVKNPQGTYCVTDIRFLNEYLHLKNTYNSEFQCYYVERPSAEEGLKAATHSSELQINEIKPLIEAHNIIKNDGTLEDLSTVVLNLKIQKIAKSKWKTKK